MGCQISLTHVDDERQIMMSSIHGAKGEDGQD